MYTVYVNFRPDCKFLSCLLRPKHYLYYKPNNARYQDFVIYMQSFGLVQRYGLLLNTSDLWVETRRVSLDRSKPMINFDGKVTYSFNIDRFLTAAGD